MQTSAAIRISTVQVLSTGFLNAHFIGDGGGRGGKSSAGFW